MIDHALGKPSHRYRKYQIFTVVLLWSAYLYKGDRHGPPILRKASAFFSRHLTPWHTMVLSMLYMYLMRNFSRLVGLEPKEPLAGKYDRDYFSNMGGYGFGCWLLEGHVDPPEVVEGYCQHRRNPLLHGLR